jgi:hypothetical protein
MYKKTYFDNNIQFWGVSGYLKPRGAGASRDNAIQRRLLFCQKKLGGTIATLPPRRLRPCSKLNRDPGCFSDRIPWSSVFFPMKFAYLMTFVQKNLILLTFIRCIFHPKLDKAIGILIFSKLDHQKRDQKSKAKTI